MQVGLDQQTQTRSRSTLVLTTIVSVKLTGTLNEMSLLWIVFFSQKLALVWNFLIVSFRQSNVGVRALGQRWRRQVWGMTIIFV